MKPLIGKDGLDLNPHDIGNDAWYYEEKDGLHVIYRGYGKIGVIKWHSLEASLKRKQSKRTKGHAMIGKARA